MTTTDKSRLLRLMIQSAAINAPQPITPEAMDRAGFTTERTPPDPFLGRRIVNEVMARDVARKNRRLR